MNGTIPKILLDAAKLTGEPTTFEEAIQWTWKFMNDEGKRTFLELGPARCHTGLGMHIRNTLNMWKTGTDRTVLMRHMYDRFRVQHPDDVSGMIMNALYALRTMQPYDPEAHAKKCREHWRRHGINPDQDMSEG